jgi:hypothetical protein
MKPPEKKPCKECPFRKKSAPGYLGRDNANHFLALTMSDGDMPCHLKVDYEKEGWKAKLSAAPRCAGSVIFFANICKRSRDPKRPTLPRSTEVFEQPRAFLDHHGGDAEGFHREQFKILSGDDE